MDVKGNLCSTGAVYGPHCRRVQTRRVSTAGFTVHSHIRKNYAARELKGMLLFPLTLARAARPEAGSAWPMLDLMEPMSRGSRSVSQKTAAMPFTSCGSPTCMQRAEKPEVRPSRVIGLVTQGAAQETGRTWTCCDHSPLFPCRGLPRTPPAREIYWTPGTENEPASAASPLKGTLHLRGREQRVRTGVELLYRRSQHRPRLTQHLAWIHQRPHHEAEVLVAAIKSRG